jgi:transcription elongation factor SPT4
MLCSIIQTYSSFIKNGCPNCEGLLQMQNSSDTVNELTSQVFSGHISLMNPKSSWVAKWQRLTEYVPGMYATKVVGRLPDDIVGHLSDNGVKYVPRDGSGGEAELEA